MTTTETRFTMFDIGCYFDGTRGVYIGEAIQAMAHSHGWEYLPHIPVIYVADVGEGHANDSLSYHEATNEAEDFLNTLTDDDVAFGPSEQGDWGLWHLCDDDQIANNDCEFCASL